MDRRSFLTALAAVSALTACADLGWAGQTSSSVAPERSYPIMLSDERWRELLSPLSYRVLRKSGTERAFTSLLNNNKSDGVYACGGCGLPLFDSRTKFDSGTGWPSFYKPIASGRVLDVPDNSLGVRRTENVCARCGGHLGHVFRDGPKPTGLRYCMNGVSLTFVPRAKVASLGDPPRVFLGGWSPRAEPTSPAGLRQKRQNPASTNPISSEIK